MPTWWERTKAKLLGHSPGSNDDAAGGSAVQQRAKWLAADQTRFGVPVLDLFSITGQLLSTSENPEAAARSISWSQSVGAELDGSSLAELEPLACALRYPADPLLGDGLLFTPREMEHKWVLALRDGQVLAARSWTGEVQAVAEARREGDELVLDVVRISKAAGFDVFGDPVETFDWLIRSHALDQVLPLPADADGAALLEAAPLTVFGPFGHMAKCAALSWDPPSSIRPLRSDGALVLAVRDADLERVRELAAAGVAIDAPSPTRGLRPLAVAVIKHEPALVELLLELGADPTLGDDRAQVPIVWAIVSGGELALLDTLYSAGARTDVVNLDLFNLLHAAAETNRAELVEWLIAHDVDLEGRTRHGHTPLHIACGLGHVEVADALLRAGADPRAEADGLDALAIAKQEHKPQSVELLELHHASPLATPQAARALRRK
ncbi:ankyrin repeat domain-containing protein [Enhygromyxa salina]|uniref:Ankyrin repeat protein n=1 Tax=Enhygromyxa salina TaxID=215803 RepID=A0A2S9XU83_9BACT|nr:ankyrin repeat domain-containing protein [Enhygromyxa salina]PRP96437.1 Ankyrin repeat protein [Enhygromyxa salina]